MPEDPVAAAKAFLAGIKSSGQPWDDPSLRGAPPQAAPVTPPVTQSLGAPQTTSDEALALAQQLEQDKLKQAQAASPLAALFQRLPLR